MKKRVLGGVSAWLVCAAMWVFGSEGAGPVRYGAKIVRTAPGLESEKPKIKILDGAGPWKVKEGEAFTGANAHECFFTVESETQGAPPPSVEVDWPGVKIKRVLGAEGAVSNTAGGVAFKLSRSRAPTSVGTPLTYGSIHMHLFHNWIVRRAGFYRAGEWPANQIQAQLNFLFAAREMCRAMGFADSGDPGFRGDIRLYGFETNFPNGHVDHPPHFHIMLGWPGWTGTQAGHFLLDETGRVLKNVLMSSNERGTVSQTYMPGEVAPMRDPDGRVGFEVMVLPDGNGVLMRRAEGQPEFRIRADVGAAGALSRVLVDRRAPGAETWQALCSVRAEDDAAKGQMRVEISDAAGKVSQETLAYDVDSGTLLTK